MNLNKPVYILTIIICFILCIDNTYAKSNLHSTGNNSKMQVLRVGILLDMPFAQNINGQYSGIAVDIWEKIARQNHWSYTYIPINENITEDLNRLTKNGDLDVIVGPISINNQRLEKVDFSVSFYLNTIGIMAKKSEWGIYDIAKSLISKNLVILIVILLLTFTVYLSLLWLIEHGRKYRNIHKNYLTVTQRIWLHLFQKRVDYMPTTTPGRIIGICWIIIAAGIFTAINANITSSMTVAKYDPNNITATIDDLQRAQLAGIIGQYSVEVAQKHGVYAKKVENLSQAVNLLVKGKIDGVICDTPQGIEYIKRHGLKNLAMSSLTLENDGIAFAVKQNSPLLRAINIGITSIQDENIIATICKKYMNDISNCYI